MKIYICAVRIRVFRGGIPSPLYVACLSDLRYGARPSPLRVFTLMLSILWGHYLDYMGIEAWSFSKAVVNEISISFRSQYLLLEKGECSALYVHAAVPD